MFLDRQKRFFEPKRFHGNSELKWGEAGDHIFEHKNFQLGQFYGDPLDMQEIVQSPSMIDMLFGEADKADAG